MPRLAVLFSRLPGLMTALVFVILSASEAAAGPGFVYAVRQVFNGANQIHGFRLDSTTGALTPLAGFPVATGGLGGSSSFSEHLAYRNGLLFVANELSSSLSVFVVNTGTGALTAAPFSPIALSGDIACVAASPNSNVVVVGLNTGMFGLVITPTTWSIAAGINVPGVSPFSCAVSRDGNFAYTGGDVGTAFAGFSVNPSNGVLSSLAGSPFSTGAGNPVGYATDSAGRLFVSNIGTGVRAFTTAAGIPTGVAGNPFPSGLAAGVMGIVNPLGFYVVADRVANQVGVFRIAGSGASTTLTAVAGSPFQTGGSFSDALTQTADGGIVVAANGVSRNLTVFQLNPGTGNLTQLVVQPVNSIGASGRVTGVAFASQGIAFGDMNGDAKGDLLLRNRSTGQNFGWLMNGTAVSVSAFLPTIADTNWEVRGMGDFDSSGRADVIWRNRSTGQNIGWLMNGLTVGAAAFLPTIADTNWQIQGTGDFNADGRADVIWRNRSTGQNIGWLMNGLVVSVSAFLPTIADTNWEIRGVGDFDGNGWADIIWRNRSTGQNIGWLMNGLVVSVSAFMPTIADTNWQIQGVGDFDGNARADVILRNRSTGQNIGWLMNGLVVSVSAFLPTIADTNWEIKGTTDTSADSKADVAWRNRSTGQNIMWLMNGLVVSASAFMPTLADTNWTFVGGVSQ